MSKIFAIITYHEPKEREEAAEAWKIDKVAAIGWSRVGDLRKIHTFEQLSRKLSPGSRGPKSLWTFLKEVKKGDLILAYATKNVIAYVGEVTGRYEFETKNNVGINPRKGGFGYSHQKHVKWWMNPHHFSRSSLPKDIAEQLGLQGRTIVELNPGSLGFKGFRGYLESNAKSLTSTSLNLNEDTIKAGIRKHLHSSLPGFENKLKITHAERGVKDHKRPDFQAKDERGNLVLVECKGVADEKAINQVKGYLKSFSKKPGTRALLIAFVTTPKCRDLAKKHKIELFECNLSFTRVV